MTLDELIQALLDIRGRIPYSGDQTVYLLTKSSVTSLRKADRLDDGIFLRDGAA